MALRVRTNVTGPQGSPWMSNLHFGGNTQTHANDAVTATFAFWTALRNHIRSGTLIRVSPEVVEIDELSGDVIRVWTTPTPADTSGLDTGQPLPVAAQGLIRWRTGIFVGGREIRGRFFCPGPTETYNTTGVPDSAYTAALGTAAAALIADVPTSFGIYSDAHNQLATVTASSVAAFWAVMRSRRD